MPRTRFRLRTIMIVIATLAIVMGAIRFAAVRLGIERVSFQVKGWYALVYLDRMVEWNARDGSETVLIGSDLYVLMIPATPVLILTGMLVGLLVVALHWRSLRRREIPMESPVDVGVQAGCSVGRPNRDGSGGPEGA
jgi:hypothetical protein